MSNDIKTKAIKDKLKEIELFIDNAMIGYYGKTLEYVETKFTSNDKAEILFIDIQVGFRYYSGGSDHYIRVLDINNWQKPVLDGLFSVFASKGAAVFSLPSKKTSLQVAEKVLNKTLLEKMLDLEIHQIKIADVQKQLEQLDDVESRDIL